MIVQLAPADPTSVRRILEALPEWFGDPPSLEEYVADAERMPNYLAYDGDTVIGVTLVNRHFAETAEIHLIAVDPTWHRRGVGRAMMTTVERDLRSQGVQLLEVKTIGPSSQDPHYAKTRKFYLRLGFLPLEELRDAWPPWPFLILVKPL